MILLVLLLMCLFTIYVILCDLLILSFILVFLDKQYTNGVCIWFVRVSATSPCTSTVYVVYTLSLSVSLCSMHCIVLVGVVGACVEDKGREREGR